MCHTVADFGWKCKRGGAEAAHLILIISADFCLLRFKEWIIVNKWLDALEIGAPSRQINHGYWRDAMARTTSLTLEGGWIYSTVYSSTGLPKLAGNSALGHTLHALPFIASSRSLTIPYGAALRRGRKKCAERRCESRTIVVGLRTVLKGQWSCYEVEHDDATYSISGAARIVQLSIGRVCARPSSGLARVGQARNGASPAG
jgi:hypothetical protein